MSETPPGVRCARLHDSTLIARLPQACLGMFTTPAPAPREALIRHNGHPSCDLPSAVALTSLIQSSCRTWPSQCFPDQPFPQAKTKVSSQHLQPQSSTNAHLLMPAQQHTHSLSTALRTTKTPTSNLCETSLLRRKTFTRRCSTSRLTLAHALVEVLHKSVADLRTALRLVDALQDGRHFRLPY
jgi:hypothetical protein